MSYYQDDLAYGPTRSYPQGVPAAARPTWQTSKTEEDLALHIRKALTPDETAPKQKHVRACFLYTWDLKSSGSFWQAMSSFPMLADEVVTFKALLTAHKVMREGHKSVLVDAIGMTSWFDNLSRSVPPHSHRGYGVLIRAYVQFIQAKLEYHRLHPEFSGTFDYDEYVTLKGVDDPNEGFETINDLLVLLDKLDALQKLIFANFRPSSNNEARIAALVPLVEESHGIYQFLVTMLTAMHQIIGSVEVLGPLREKFNAGHYALFRFYHECSTLKYLTSLITVPRLSQDPPNFLAQPPTLPPRSQSPDKQSKQNEIDRFNEEQNRLERQLMEDHEREQQRLQAERELEMARQRQQQQQEAEQQRQLQEAQRAQAEFMRRQEAERARMEAERLRMQQQTAAANSQMEQQLNQQRFINAQNELDQYRNQCFQYDQKVRALEQQLAQLSVGSRDMDVAKDDLIRRLQDELAQWKQKYEALAKLYAQLRKDHLAMLTNFKDVRDGANRQTEQARQEVERARADLKLKTTENTELLIERDRLKGDVDRLRAQYEEQITRVRSQYDEEMGRLRHELSDAKASLGDLTNSKGAEMQNIMSRFESEKRELEDLVKSKQHQLDELTRTRQEQLDELRRSLEEKAAELQRARSGQEEDAAVLTAGLDQTLLALAAQQKLAQEAQQGWEQANAQLDGLRSTHQRQLNSNMDNLLASCITTVDEAIYKIDSPANMGNQTASPEYVLSLLERAQGLCGDFGSSFVKLVQTGDHKDAIATSTGFAHAIAQLLDNAKGVTRLAAEDDELEEIIRTVKMGALGGRLFFDQVKSVSLDTIDAAKRPEHIVGLSRETQHQLGRMSGVIEKLVVHKLDETKENLEDEVEKSMRSAANAIEEAAKRLEALLNKPREGADLDVHSAILQSAIAITSAIALLIKRATETQQEIVAHGRGSTTTGQFYKKNNKWTEGLISAAQAVATATTMLVEVADGLVSGSHSYEQLVVAAQEVSVATTQLVAASRVKSIPFSKTQVKLEDAAVAVRKATELLVKAAKEAAKRGAEEKAQTVGKLNRHQLKVAEMEQKVKILELEKDLMAARSRLGAIVKLGYKEDGPGEDE
ncbi:ANTH domain-containing protein [Geranomyces variabilis]|nr:ANTH domain-containing protein [Geranomyces variabilis]KAJ3137324.1 sla2 Src-like adaptor 2 [Geranomyces variabilis]